MGARLPTSRRASTAEGSATAGKSAAATRGTATPAAIKTPAHVPGSPHAADQTGVVAQAAHNRNHDQPSDNQEQKEPGGVGPMLYRVGNVGLSDTSGVAAQHPQDCHGAGNYSGVEIPAAELRQDVVLDDHAGAGVRQFTFQPVAKLDPDLALLGRHDQQSAGVPALLANSPKAPELIAEILDRVALQ